MAAQASQTQPVRTAGPAQAVYSAPESAGYQALGDVMGSHPEAAIYRRFRNAGALDLLYRQADLQHSFMRWANLSAKDKATRGTQAADEDRRNFDLHFHLLLDSVDPNDLSKSEQWTPWCKISEKLDQYYDKILRFQKICNLAAVDKNQLHSLRMFLDEQREATNDIFLAGREHQIYGQLNEEDLTAIATPQASDKLTKWIHGYVTDLVHRRCGHATSHRTITVPRLIDENLLAIKFTKYADEKAEKVSMALYAIITTGYVMFAVATLSHWQGTAIRIPLIFLHNILFTLTMAFLTHVRPVELFAAAAAYSAVLVVFASNPCDPSSSSTA